MASLFFAWLHHLLTFGIVTCLSIQLASLRHDMNLDNAKRIALVDLIYGSNALLLLIVGSLRVFYFEKGSEYYLSSWAFYLKLLCFAGIGLLSILPTKEFLSWRKFLTQEKLPPVSEAQIKRLRKLIHWQLVLLPIILLMAVMMAKAKGV